jgi:hypothetical protein
MQHQILVACHNLCIMIKHATKRSLGCSRGSVSKIHAAASDSLVIESAVAFDNVDDSNLSTQTIDPAKSFLAPSGNEFDLIDETNDQRSPMRSSHISGGISSNYDRPNAAIDGAYRSPQSGFNRERFMSQAVSAVVASGVGPIAPASPGSNRERFMSNCQPTKVCCDLSVVGLHSSSTRFSFQAIILIVYPATVKPERRHLQLIDSRGSTGITVWNEHVSMFSQSSVGQVVRFSRICLNNQNGQKSLAMSRDSTVAFVSDASAACEESKWWRSLLDKRPFRIIDIHDMEDNNIVNVAGIVGTLSTETKRVRNEDKDLMCMRITDRTGYIDVRSWNHSEIEFISFRERPILFKRVRVTSFAGLKIIELLDASGTEVLADFEGASDLKLYWTE